ncbi:hypothetical protein PMAYCL1PPCAC_20317, partial [Pristionchus mayeri]
QIVSAVDHIHEKNIIHRDLKPANILFAEMDWLKVCDLGISTLRTTDGVDTALSRTSNMGTPLYMSPEQYGSKTDIFALGLILTELCTWKPADELSLIFENYRLGMRCDLEAGVETAAFVRMLTELDPDSRPSCKEMLEHKYLLV